MSQPSPWWTLDVHADRQPFLRARRRVLAALRYYLETRDFAEVEIVGARDYDLIAKPVV